MSWSARFAGALAALSLGWLACQGDDGASSNATGILVTDPSCSGDGGCPAGDFCASDGFCYPMSTGGGNGDGVGDPCPSDYCKWPQTCDAQHPCCGSTECCGGTCVY